ncbi:MAG: two-component regulator propeller domain-containing protein [Labilibaculum antarcticum]
MNQLPSNSVLRVFQDSEGYIWFGTPEGLCRYDGYRIKIFRSDIYTPNLLTSNEISCIAEDNNDNLWIGTHEGLSIINRNTYQIKVHPDTLLQSKAIRDILIGSDSTIWVGVTNAVYRYNPDFSLKKGYTHNPNDSKSIPNGGINKLFEDSYHNIWLTLWEKGLHKYDIGSDRFIQFPKIGRTNNPFEMFQDNQNNYWIGTWNDGLFKFNPNTKNNELYTKISIPKTNGSDEEKTFFSFIQDDYLEYIWAMSLSGLHAFHYNKNNEIEEVNLKNTLKNTNHIFSEITKDENGSLWIGAFSEGAFKIDFNKPSIKNFPTEVIKNNMGPAPSFTTVFEDYENDIWLNQNRFGLCLYSPQKNEFRLYSEIDQFKNIEELKNISCVCAIEKKHEVWLANTANSKIFRFRKEAGHITYLNYYDLSKTSKNQGTPQLFFTDNQSSIWIGTTTGLFYKSNLNKEPILITDKIGSVNAITQDANNNIWVSTYNSGIYHIKHPKTTINKSTKLTFEKFNSQLISNHIQSIKADHSGKIWIGTKEGKLLYLDNSTKLVYDRTLNCGLSGEAILDIVIDKYNHVWLSTCKSIIEFNPTNNAYYMYSHSDGMLINSILKGSFFISKDSRYIYFGGNRGYSCFYPSEKLTTAPQETEVKITDIKIQNKSIFHSNNQKIFNRKSNVLELNPDDKNIEFDFSTLNYTSPEKIKYAYKLEGIDNDWVYVKKDRQFAIYNQLKKGQYTFMVKASDAHNLWSNKITKLKIIRKPALYETHVAYLLYFIIVASSLFTLIYFIINRVALRNKVKMTQFEKNKSEEITQTKLKYFTNISHDLLTPLTIISCLIDDLETSSPKKSSQFSIMRSNVVRLKRLLQQILDFRRIEDGKMQLRITHTDIVSFIKDVCYNHFLPIFNKKQISFSFHSSPPEIEAYFDADKIDKMLFNLLSNAFKYTPENGKISIIISLHDKNEHSYLSIKVCDTGIGISTPNSKEIFTRFYTNRTMSASETHGIGLSLTKDLVELHHGHISVESELNKGTEFTIEIPIDKSSYSVTEISTNTILDISDHETDTKSNFFSEDIISGQIGPKQASNVTVLLVEDNIELLQLMQQMLSRSYHILTATNGIKAMDIIKSTDIDIVISDVMMPEMDGVELCETLKGHIDTSHISVILLTAKNSIEDRIECYKAGADAYISKPFEMKVLEARINNFLSNRHDKQKEFKSNLEINISSLEYPSIDKQFLNNAIAIIEKYISETDFDINMFAEELNLSKSTLYRKIKTITGLSPIEFIRNIKLKHASLMLKNNSISVSEVAYSVGFTDPKYFASCFKAEFNITPSEYQKKQ